MCEDCDLKNPYFGIREERKKRWCTGCAKKYPGTVYMGKMGPSRRISEIENLLRVCPVKMHPLLMQERDLLQQNADVRQKKNAMGYSVKAQEDQVKRSSLRFLEMTGPYSKAKSGADKFGAAILDAVKPLRHEEDFGPKVLAAANMIVQYAVANVEHVQATSTLASTKKELALINAEYQERIYEAARLQQSSKDMASEIQTEGGLPRTDSADLLTLEAEMVPKHSILM